MQRWKCYAVNGNRHAPIALQQLKFRRLCNATHLPSFLNSICSNRSKPFETISSMFWPRFKPLGTPSKPLPNSFQPCLSHSKCTLDLSSEHSICMQNALQERSKCIPKALQVHSKCIPDHSKCTPRAPQEHSESIPRAFQNHSKSIPKAFQEHSKSIPKAFQAPVLKHPPV